MEIVEDIKAIELRLETATPHELVEMKRTLSAVYSRMSQMLMVVLRRKPIVWNELRRTAKSDTAAERMWESTAEGLDEMEIRQWLKIIEKHISSINSSLRVAEGEANGSGF